MKEVNDWRLLDQDEYMKGEKLLKTVFNKETDGDHEHCEFCWAKFSAQPEDLHSGYCTLDRYRWICETCFEDFKDDFEWQVINEQSGDK